jgi:multidrug efflux pump subunit AcrB
MVPNVFPVMIVFGYMGWRGILIDVGTMMTASVAMGIAVDNTIHYLTWFGKGIDSGLKPRDAALQAYERCATAMSQTVFICGLGLSAFAFSTFTPTQMFGKMMLSILLVSIFGDLIFLPAILTGRFGKFFVPKQSRKGGSDNTADKNVSPSSDDMLPQKSDRNYAAFNVTGVESDPIRQMQTAHAIVTRPNVLSDHVFRSEKDYTIHQQ